ncbi:PHP domain-containing protein [Halocatena marina]|uniref:PHP domain-containing protein n=1 Tax=Halocatena marina TaxID=2934937 RepID=A0ABD5YQA2_9EURY|nr:PHP domain-containing protein [Halocatena marina]
MDVNADPYTGGEMAYTYDLQVHTDASPCSNAAPADVVAAAVSRDLDGIAVTNHDTLAGVAAVRTTAPDELTVISGVEVSTTQGHLLALNVEEPPPQGDPLSVIEHVHDLGGVAILSHPFDRLREHYASNLDAIAAAVDAIEVRNSRCLRTRYNERARAFAREHDLPVTGASDAHFPMEIGRAYTTCERPLLEALQRGETSSGGRDRYLSGHAATKLHQLNESLGLNFTLSR